MRRMSAGSGYQYLLKSVAVGDGNRVLSTTLTRYYAEVGTPPGRWMGSGLGGFGAGQITEGAVVTEEQLALLLGMGRDPVTGEQLGRAYPTYGPAADDPERPSDGKERHAVAGYDLTFSVPKSVSVLWGLAGADVQARIVEAHHAAVADTMAYFEREVAATRAGFADRDGAVAQVAVDGFAAAAFDHFDSRSSDPQLHTHVVVANKVRTVMDGRWRSLDGRPVYASRTALSGLYDALVVDRLSRELGVEWELRQRGPERNPRWELAGVPDGLIHEFSGRTRQIEKVKDDLIADYVARYGRRPSAKVIVEMRAQATLATRPAKEVRSLVDLTDEWRTRAEPLLGRDLEIWAEQLAQTGSCTVGVERLPDAVINELGGRVVDSVAERRAVWSHWNLVAEACKLTTGLPFATTGDREATVRMMVEVAQAKSVMLTPPELATSPTGFRRPDGSSVFRQRHGEKYSAMSVLDAEARLLKRVIATDGPAVAVATVERNLGGHGHLSDEQHDAVEAIAGSGRRVDLLVGPAGAGKTTTMCALTRAWTAVHGAGSVVGLAPSAAAAQVLGADLALPCENTAKWLHEHNQGRAALRSGQLVIVDEATLASTTVLDRITQIAGAAGAKVLLVGDPYQLQAVDAGGAFALLADRRPDAPQLRELHRFTHDWEKTASLALRSGEVGVIDTYIAHERIRGGQTDAMLGAAYEAWAADLNAGLASLLVADSTSAVRDLNERARAERMLHNGAAGTREVELREGCRASVGDLVITRRNDRTLATATGGWVKNGDRWRIARVRRDGSVVVVSATEHSARALLPADYVRTHLDLGYAVTAHRAQGATVDTAHVIVTSSTTRENLYVAMTRGRSANVAYVGLDQTDDAHLAPDDDVSARSVLYGVLRNTGASLSAHQAIEAEHESAGSITRLAAELETIAAEAQHDRFVDLLGRSGLSPDQLAAVVHSTAFGPLSAALRRAEAHHHDLETLIPRAVGRHRLDNADDVAAVLTYRFTQLASSAPSGQRTQPQLIAGLIPEPLGPMSAEHRQAIDERKHLIESRATALARDAATVGARWIRQMGDPPADPSDASTWWSNVAAVAAYRDRYEIADDNPLMVRATTDSQQSDRRRAAHAVRRATALGGRRRPIDQPAPETNSAPGL